MWVVKLGGSLDRARYLRDWIRALAATPVPVIVVPGGGGFADQVRESQRRWTIDDATAHRMAILAMEQTAHLICAMSPGLIPTPLPARANPREPCCQVWFPARALLWDSGIPHDWDVTSDSLAAILAHRIRATGLVLVKSASFKGRSMQVHKLQDEGILDRAFADRGHRCGCPVWLLEGRSSEGFRRLVSGHADGALRVCFDRNT